MPRRFSFGPCLTGLLTLSTLAVLILAERQPSQGHTVSGNPQEQRHLPRKGDGSLFPSLLAMRDVGRRQDEFEVEEKGITVDLGGGVKLELVRIPAGRFLMGLPKGAKDGSEAERPQHWVEITRPFYLGRYEVTQEQYRKVMADNPSAFSTKGEYKKSVRGIDTSRFAVENVSWEEAQRFCKKLDLTKTRRGSFCLPTEAEWEYACRAGTATHFHFGKKLNGRQANCDGRKPVGTEEEGPYLGRPTVVGSYPANAWGLFDMHGNVDEWCQDRYDERYYAKSPRQDPQGPDGGSLRVLRGGSWNCLPKDCTAAARAYCAQINRVESIGFRVAYRPN